MHLLHTTHYKLPTEFMTIGIIGAGTMGAALASAFLKSKLFTPGQIRLADPSEEKLAPFRRMGCHTSQDSNSAVFADVVLIAVKPQSFEDLANEITGKIPEKTLLISIMAGVNLKTLMKRVHHKKIVRAMPNTPAMLGQGVLGWISSATVQHHEKDLTRTILSAAGFAYEVEEEHLIDDITCLSGCGPGFFLYILDEWLKAAKVLDLPPELVKTMMIKTFQGSLALLDHSKSTPLALAEKVASKGGATEAGLLVLKHAKLQKLFQKMLKTAYNRCKKLGK